jgi:hypothetical protein
MSVDTRSLTTCQWCGCSFRAEKFKSYGSWFIAQVGSTRNTSPGQACVRTTALAREGNAATQHSLVRTESRFCAAI